MAPFFRWSKPVKVSSHWRTASTLKCSLFLEKRPLYTAYLAGLLRDNGLQSPLNRGTFHGYRDFLGKLEGVGLVGHATLMETTSDRALQAFAKTAQQCKTVQ